MLSIGLMSGTSMDGIDCALLATNGHHGITDLGHVFIPYDLPFKLLLKSAEHAVKKYAGEIQQAHAHYADCLKDYLANQLNFSADRLTDTLINLATYLPNTAINAALTFTDIIAHSTHLHVQAVKILLAKTGYIAKQIDVIGYHGQTLYHAPAKKMTLQIGDGAQLAEQLGIPVVNNFRSADMVAGGQGAPLAPLYHHALAVRDHKIPVAVVNCGGIANLTLITGSAPTDIIAFDTGPGNALLDQWIRRCTQGKEHMDKNGRYGQQGNIDQALLNALYERAILINGHHNYFNLKPPKSLDYGDIQFVAELTESTISLANACRTLAAFTADTIVNSLDLVAEVAPPQQWLLAGGGWQNPVILAEFQQRLHTKLGNVNVFIADAAGWNSQALEAQIFAYLAVRRLNNLPTSYPGITGATKPICGGDIHLP